MSVMAERRRIAAPGLEITGLNVYYGASHALQGVNLTLQSGVLSVVGRNGMGKSTLCNAIMGLVRIESGSIRFNGEELAGRTPSDISQLGIGYVPQGRRLWRSLTVDEHLRLVGAGRRGAWTIERIYSTFPRLAERKNNSGGQLSGGEQQMLAIGRALVTNPGLLVMDEPTEGLAPVIVSQVEDMLLRIGEQGEIDVLVIEQNIHVATTVSERVGIMMNGRIGRMIDSAQLAADRELQQRLLGVGRHAEGERADVSALPTAASDSARPARTPPGASTKIYIANPVVPNRWTKPVPVRQIEQAARTVTDVVSGAHTVEQELRALASPGDSVVLVVGTLDTKGEELRYIRDLIQKAELGVRLVDLSTTGRHTGADIPAHQVAAYHTRGASGVFVGDRGEAVAAMTLAFERWIARQNGIAGVIAAGGSGGTAMVAPGMRALTVGIPKLIISTIASGDVSRYVGASDIMMMHSVADVQGLNSITRAVLANGANAMAGMVKARRNAAASRTRADRRGGTDQLPAVGLTMFGVTTPCVQQVTAALKGKYDCLVFHATGIGGQSMEKLVDSGLVQGVIDISTTEVCDLLMGGKFPATDDRFGAIIRQRMPYVGSCGALDMVNFGAPDTVPEKYRGRLLYHHNPQITLMRTTPDENAAMGRWIGDKLNQMTAPVQFFLPEGGVSMLDAPGQPFHDPAADQALFSALEATVRQTATRQLIRLPHHINDAAFAAELVRAFLSMHGGGRPQRRQVVR
jgi:uncharacterized protein (UPF0261 family)/ABC-type branched-subunit amino acid transport system ATPase component